MIEGGVLVYLILMALLLVIILFAIHFFGDPWYSNDGPRRDGRSVSEMLYDKMNSAGKGDRHDL
jgi:hypothetical protein